MPGKSCPFCFSFFPAQKEGSLVPHGGVLNCCCLIGALFLLFLRYVFVPRVYAWKLLSLGGKLVAVLAFQGQGLVVRLVICRG